MITDVRYVYLSLDSDHSIAASALVVGLDGTTYPQTATSVAAPAGAASLPAPATGMVRYWWQILVGPGQALVPVASTRTLYGQLTDTPEVLHPVWAFVP